MPALSTEVRQRFYDDITAATDALINAWADEDVEQFCLTLEEEGWRLSFPEPPL